MEAAKYAAEQGEILCALNLSRFIRAEAYHRVHNIDAIPTPDEFAKLRELTLGVPLATLHSPLATESVRHIRATKMGKSQGRPKSVPLDMMWKIVQALGTWDTEEFPQRYETPVATVAARFRVSKSAVDRLLTKRIPGTDGLCLRDLMANPFWRTVRRDAVLEALERLYQR